MEPMIIGPTDETPAVWLEPADNKFEISGRSLPEDVTTFYNPVLDWFDNYSLAPNDSTNMVFKMDYFNTASSKLILDILMKLEELSENGNQVKVEWYYREDDEDMEEAGEEYADIVEVDFSLHAY